MRNLLYFFLRNYFIFLFLILEGISFLLIFQYNAFQRSGFIGATRTLTSVIQEKFSGVRSYFHLRWENEVLSLENTRLRNELAAKGIMEKEPGFITDTVSRNAWQFIPARVVTASVDRQYNYLTVNKGRKQGIHPDMAVITETGVVGIVLGVSDNYSTVIPVLNRNFRLSAKVKKNNFFGIVEWDGRSPETASLREIPVHVFVEEGDTVVTSGHSAVFPEGILVGTIESIKESGGNFHDIQIRLSTDYRKLYHLNLIRFTFRDEILKLENQGKDD